MQKVIRLSIENIRLRLQRGNCRHGVFRSNVSKTQARNEVGSVESFEVEWKADDQSELISFSKVFCLAKRSLR